MLRIFYVIYPQNKHLTYYLMYWIESVVCVIDNAIILCLDSLWPRIRKFTTTLKVCAFKLDCLYLYSGFFLLTVILGKWFNHFMPQFPSTFERVKWDDETAALNMPANLGNSAVTIVLEKDSFHFNPKERKCQRMLKLPHSCTHLTR